MKVRFLFLFILISSAAFGQIITGTVTAVGKEGEFPAAYVNVFIFNKKKDKISQGKTNGSGFYKLHPQGGYRFIEEENYRVLIEPDPLEKSLGGPTVKRKLIKAKGSELNNMEIKVSAVGGGKSQSKAPNHLKSNPRIEEK